MARKTGREKGSRQVGYAVIGLGHIAQSAVLPAFAHAKNSKLVALVSGDAEKRTKLARKYRCDAYDVRHLDDVLDDRVGGGIQRGALESSVGAGRNGFSHNPV